MSALEFTIVAVVIIAWAGAIQHLHRVFSRQSIRDHEKKHHGGEA